VYSELDVTEHTDNVPHYSSPRDVSIAMVDTYVECGLGAGKTKEEMAAAAVYGSLVHSGHTENLYRIANMCECASTELREMARDMISLIE